MTSAISFELPELTIPYLGPLLDAQTAVNGLWMRGVPDLPPLYSLYPRIFYYEDPHHDWACPKGSIPVDSLCNTERFTTIPTILLRRYADCKCLCAWRAAELRREGENARAVAIPASDPRYIHVVVERGNGTREDVSRRMGMADYFAAKRAGQARDYFRRMMLTV